MLQCSVFVNPLCKAHFFKQEKVIHFRNEFAILDLNQRQ